MNKAILIGLGAMWRDQARIRTGTGGAGGADIHSPWGNANSKRYENVFANQFETDRERSGSIAEEL